jgi:hypothetical protein
MGIPSRPPRLEGGTDIRRYCTLYRHGAHLDGSSKGRWRLLRSTGGLQLNTPDRSFRSPGNLLRADCQPWWKDERLV